MIIFSGLERWKYALFVFTNLVAVLSCLSISGLLSNFNALNFQIVISSVLIILFQYPFLYKSKSWGKKLTIFYVSFLIFCFSFTFFDFWINFMQFNGVESVLGLLFRGVLFTLFGHLYGLVFLPVIVVVNIFFGKYYFKNILPG